MSAVARVRAAYRRIEEVGRPEAWIALRPEPDALRDAADVESRLAAGELLPLAGATLAVKDNIDVAGLATTAACPAFAYEPEADAVAVARLSAAGAVVLGKTNLDQFATGLVGTRSPYGAVRDSRRPDRVSGGSSSGSAVAVALGIADLALGTDTAGSGRVPAAFQGIFGVKPTRGLVSTLGVVPACRSLDCVTVFARDLRTAELGIGAIEGVHPEDPGSRPWPADAPLGASGDVRIGVPTSAGLVDLTDAARATFVATARQLEIAGAELAEIDIEPLLGAGELLYDGGFVAERHAAVGRFVKAHPDEVDPVVGALISAAGGLGASAWAVDQERLAGFGLATRNLFTGLDAILLPTTTKQPLIAEVERDPFGTNAALGRYTNCVNLLDLCAIAVPAGEADGDCFGVSLVAPAFADRAIADMARLLVDDPTESVPTAGSGGPEGIDLFVVGAHLRGQSLNHELTDAGARLVGADATVPSYRLFRLATEPEKPGLVRVGRGGARVPGEVWRLSPASLGQFLARLPPPMALGPVQLEAAGRVVGFCCERIALEEGEDITAAGGWVDYLAGRGASG
jgi:allophanate hydrolase